MRVIFFGTPNFAVPTLQALLDSPHQVVGVVTQPDRPSGRGQKLSAPPVKVLALARALPVLQPARMKDPALVDALGAWRADVGVVAAYGRILPESLLLVPRLGMVNVHASLLPAYRGAAPVHRAVMAGETVTGVTIMQVVRELDAGDMLAKVELAIGPDATSEEIEGELAQAGAKLLVSVLDALPAFLEARVRQDDSAATYAPRLEKPEGEIDWHLPARDIHNRVRGLTPWPLAHTFVQHARLVVRRTHRSDSHGGTSRPGDLVEIGPDGLVVACGGASTLRIVEVQPEGRRSMSVRDYLAGHSLERGLRLGRPSA